MRTVTAAVAIVALVVGVGLVGLSVYAGLEPISATAPAKSALTITPSTIGALRATIRWTGAGTNDTVYVTDATVSCLAPAGVVASGVGNNGSVTLDMNSGTTYYLFGCSGAGGLVEPHFTYTLFGLTIYLLFGVLLLIAGIFMLLIALRPAGPEEAPRPAREEPPAPPSAPAALAMPENMRVPPVFDDVPEEGASPPRSPEP